MSAATTGPSTKGKPTAAEMIAAASKRPRLRGHIHFWSFVATFGAGAALIAVAASTVSGYAALAASIYVATVLGMFGTSALYHRTTWTNHDVYTWMKRADHSMIFLLIAGTYTPFTMLAMDQPLGWIIFGVVWGGAVLGITMKMFWPTAPRWLGVPIYVALGWVAVFAIPTILAHAGVAALVMMFVGGFFYTFGAVCYAVKWPNIWPKTFGYHEVFHLFTVLAAICHYIAIWFAMYA